MRPLLLRTADHQAAGLVVVPGYLVQLVGQLIQLQGLRGHFYINTR